MAYQPVLEVVNYTQGDWRIALVERGLSHEVIVHFAGHFNSGRVEEFIAHIDEQRDTELWTFHWYENTISFNCSSHDDAIFIAMNWQ